VKQDSSVKTSATFMLAAAAATGAASSSADARDRSEQASTNWTGFFVGGSLGATWLNANSNDSGISGNYGGAIPLGTNGQGKTNQLGFLAGVQGGYNWQQRNFVYGIEGDISWLGGGTASVSGNGTSYTGYSFTRGSRVDALATVRGRVGIDFDGTLPYLTAGFAAAMVKNSYTMDFTGRGAGYGSGTASKTSFVPGIAVGAGIEHKLNSNWSIRGEYLWIGLADTSLNPNLSIPIGGGFSTTSTGSVKFSNDISIVKIGMNYRF
jgi:outer membrane immunogenic protein